MARIRGLELLFSLVQQQLKSKEDCLIAAYHCLLINDGLQCVGIGDEWPTTSESTTELLPKDWNSNQEVYSLRYVSKDRQNRYLLKIVKAGHTLHVNFALDESDYAMASVEAEDYISDNYNEYATAYKDVEGLVNSFKSEIMEKLKPKANKKSNSSSKRFDRGGSSPPPQPLPRPSSDLGPANRERFSYPQIGGRDLDPFGMGQGGMLMDPSNFGVPSRPTMPHMGIGGPGGLPRGSVPPGARFDPIGPPIPGPNRFNPNPDHFKPPDFDDEFM